jgi:hypothetical protein
MNRMILARWAAFLGAGLLVAGTAGAQELQLDTGADHIAPQIQHQPPQRAVPGRQPLTIDAIVTDNVGVDKVTLFFRPVGSTDYRDLDMVRTTGDRFAGVVDAKDVVDPGLEYYIQAADGAGNTALRGFSFSPLMVAVGKAAPGPALASTGAEGPRPWYKKPVVWAIVGGVVIAAAAAGGGGGGGGGAGGQTVTFTGNTPSN